MKYQGFDNIVDFLQMKLQELPLQPHGIIYREAAEYLASALSAAEIGDVTEWKDKATAAELVAQAAANTAIERIEEWKHRAEVWKQATKDMIDTDICFGCHARATGICFKQGPNPGTDECMNAIYKQAEKELQEGNGGKKEV